MQYVYKIADIKVLCDMPFSVSVNRESLEFLADYKTDICPDIKVLFQPVEAITQFKEEGFWDIDRYHDCEAVYFCDAPKGRPYARVFYKGQEIVCEYIKEKEFLLRYSICITDILSLDDLLLRNSGLILHASFIRWNGKGILFSAPSGTGKSTQAELWQKFENADIINGDRAGIRKIDNKWLAYGLPYAGSSYIYRNEAAPVTSIVVLRQAKHNHIRMIKPSEAFRLLYPEIIIHQWDRVYTEKAINLLMELIGMVPIFLLECLPNQNAVELVKDIIKDL